MAELGDVSPYLPTHDVADRRDADAVLGGQMTLHLAGCDSATDLPDMGIGKPSVTVLRSSGFGFRRRKRQRFGCASHVLPRLAGCYGENGRGSHTKMACQRRQFAIASSIGRSDRSDVIVGEFCVAAPFAARIRRGISSSFVVHLLDVGGLGARVNVSRTYASTVRQIPGCIVDVTRVHGNCARRHRPVRHLTGDPVDALMMPSPVFPDVRVAIPVELARACPKPAITRSVGRRPDTRGQTSVLRIVKVMHALIVSHTGSEMVQ